MNKSLIIPVTAIALAGLACSPINVHVNVPRITTGPTQTFTVSEPLPDTKSATDVMLTMTAGEFNLSGGGDGLVEGTIRYNVPDWKPATTSSAGSFSLDQGQANTDGFPSDDVVNQWNIKLGNAPMNLVVKAGAYKGDFDLSGVPLTNLEINDGASDSNVVFSSLNPSEMDTFSYRSGAAQVKLSGLANANFRNLDFTGGAGDYTLDFSGELQRDATVSVDAGVGSVKIIVPANTAANVVVTNGVGNVDVSGTWASSNNGYSTNGSGKTLTIMVKLGVGSLELRNH
jgi:hypothetical protein